MRVWSGSASRIPLTSRRIPARSCGSSPCAGRTRKTWFAFPSRLPTTVQPLERQAVCNPARPRFVRTMTPGCGVRTLDKTCKTVGSRPVKRPCAEAGWPQSPTTRRTESPIRRLMVATAPFACWLVACLLLKLSPFNSGSGDVSQQWYRRLLLVLLASTFRSSTLHLRLWLVPNSTNISWMQRSVSFIKSGLNQRKA
jgi:hypothetical protein